MWIGLVIVLAGAVGGGVYLLSLRSLDGTRQAARGRPAGAATTTGVSPPAAAPPTPAIAGAAQAAPAAIPGTVYVPLALDERPSITTRFVRLLGLIALVGVAGLILAVSIWQAAAAIGDLLRHYLGS
jgi:hypothetical protein